MVRHREKSSFLCLAVKFGYHEIAVKLMTLIKGESEK
jgi:hypothetical protein